MLNVPLLRKIKDQITAHPNDFYMCSWKCGTACCIGGWALTLSGVDFRDEDAELEELASLALGLTKGQANGLFYANCWPKDLRARYYQSSNEPNWEERQAAIACERIDRLITECEPGWVVAELEAEKGELELCPSI